MAVGRQFFCSLMVVVAGGEQWSTAVVLVSCLIESPICMCKFEVGWSGVTRLFSPLGGFDTTETDCEVKKNIRGVPVH